MAAALTVLALCVLSSMIQIILILPVSHFTQVSLCKNTSVDVGAALLSSASCLSIQSQSTVKKVLFCCYLEHDVFSKNNLKRYFCVSCCHFRKEEK